VADSILVSGLRINARIGVTAEERAVLQPLEIDVEMVLDRKMVASDDLSATIDYTLVEQIARSILSEPVKLLETVAVRLADSVAKSSASERLRRVEVKVAKLAPPIETTLKSASVKVVRDLHP
jgi:dihydroneopterin aldolase